MGETIYYIDRSPMDGALFADRSRGTVVYTGLGVQAEEDGPLLEQIDRLCGLRLIRRGREIALPLYGVPWLCAFALDDRGGVFAGAGDRGPVYYIPPSLLPSPVAASYGALLEKAAKDPDWRRTILPGGPWPRLPEEWESRAALAKALGLPRPEPDPPSPSPPLRVFPSREAAEREFRIWDPWELLRQKRTPRFQVWPMLSPADREGKAYVHHRAWMETYAGLMDQRILDRHTLERCRDITSRHPENTLVLLDRERDDRVAGFACYVPKARDFVSVPEASEIQALYVLAEYQGLGLGRMLMEACLARLHRPRTALFVLRGNAKAIGFYEHMGFHMTGYRRTDQMAGAEITELEMVRDADA